MRHARHALRAIATRHKHAMLRRFVGCRAIITPLPDAAMPPPAAQLPDLLLMFYARYFSML